MHKVSSIFFLFLISAQSFLHWDNKSFSLVKSSSLSMVLPLTGSLCIGGFPRGVGGNPS